MKKLFMTGLVLILPLAITIIILMFLVNFFTAPFLVFVESPLIYFDLISIKHPVLLAYVGKIVILVFLICLIFFLGVAAQWYVQKHLIELTDFFFSQIPFVNKIYKTSRELVQTLFTSKTNSFKQVVLVPYPNHDSQAIGLVAQENLPEGSDPEIEDLVPIYVLGSPNPTYGFVLLYRPKDLVYLDMSVKEAMKGVVSCGVILSDIKTSNKPIITTLKPKRHK